MSDRQHALLWHAWVHTAVLLVPQRILHHVQVSGYDDMLDTIVNGSLKFLARCHDLEVKTLASTTLPVYKRPAQQ